jgi:predicted DNA-binding transcriptional regulator
MKSDNRPMHIHWDKVEDLGGLSLIYVPKGHYYWRLEKASITSDQPDFYTCIEQISNVFLNRVAISTDSIYQFLVLIHEDLSADMFVNDLRIDIEILAKTDKKKMEAVYKKDIADIRKLRFSGQIIEKTDQVICCFKVGWKFALYFDFSRELNVEEMELALGKLYRGLSFQHVFEVFEKGAQFKEMVDDGWFPFVELIGGDYEELSKAYEDKVDFENRIENIFRRFDSERIRKITDRWWKKSVFVNRKPVIEAGISSFLLDDEAGYINCINTLLPQVEGIIRLQYHSETGKDKDVSLKEKRTYIIRKGGEKYKSGNSLLFPIPLLKYLNDVVYANFNLESGEIDLSRHSVSHGVAKPEDYTKYKALQVILLLDQIYFFID